MKWISVEEGLPEKGVRVQIFRIPEWEMDIKQGSQDVSHIDDRWGGWSNPQGDFRPVTHWKPLGPPPEKEGEE